MGVQNLDELCRELVAHGRAPTTPAAMVQQATTSAQRVVSAVHESARVLSEEHGETGTTLKVRAPAMVLGRIRAQL